MKLKAIPVNFLKNIIHFVSQLIIILIKWHNESYCILFLN